MVEINNQRKAFLDMLAWSEGTDNGRQKTRNHGYDVIVGGKLFTDYSDHLANLSLNPKLKSGAGRYQLLSRWVGVPTASSLAWKTSLRKVRTLWHCGRLRSVALYLWLIGVDINQAIDRCNNIWASLPGAGYGQFEHKADSLIAKFKEAGGTVREIDVWAESPRLSPLWLSTSSSACHGLLIVTVITPLPTKPSATKCQKGRSWQTRRCGMQMKPAWCCCARCKIHEELADAKAENDALRDALVVVGCTSKRSVSQCVKPPPPPAWMIQPPRLADTAERDYFTLREKWSLCKNNWKEPRSILIGSADRVAHIDGQLM